MTVSAGTRDARQKTCGPAHVRLRWRRRARAAEFAGFAPAWAINDQENAFLDALSKATTYQINGNQLQITYDGGVLTFNGA